MNTEEAELRRSARAGDAGAIALLVNGWLDRYPRLSCHVEIVDATWQLLLVSPRELPQGGVLSVLRYMLGELAPPGISRVEVKAVTTGAERSRWHSRIELSLVPELAVAKPVARRRWMWAPALVSMAASLVLAVQILTPDTPYPVEMRESSPNLPSTASLSAHLEQVADALPAPQPQQAQSFESSAKPATERQTSSPRLAQTSAPAVPPRKVAAPLRLRIKAVGDLLPGTNYRRRRLLSRQEEQALLTELQGLLGGADLVFGNLETVLTDHPYSTKGVSPNVHAFRTPPRYAEWLKAAGFDLLSIANNHAMDFGPKGFADTIRHLHQAGIHGIGEPDQIRYVRRAGVVIALLGFSHNRHLNSLLDLEQARALVRTAQEKADLVLVSVHAGAEGTAALRVTGRPEYYLGEARGNPQQFARALIDEGADLILGHGPHVPRAIELYRGRLVAYSLGNFIGYGGLSSAGATGASLVLEAELDEDGAFVAGRIVPLRLDRRGLPRPDPRAGSLKLIRKLSRRDIPGSELVITGDGWLAVSSTYAGLSVAGNEG